MGDEERERRQAWIVSTPHRVAPGDAEPTVWSLTVEERLQRGLVRAGITRIGRIEPHEPAPAATGPCIVVRDDVFYDERVLEGLLGAQDVVLHHALSPSGPEPVAAACRPELLPEAVATVRSGDARAQAGLQPASVLDLASAYDRSLRKQHLPWVYAARGQSMDFVEVENELFAASYKGITDLVTKWVFPRPARATVRVLARWGVRPNTVTSCSYLLAAAVTWLFAEGWLATGLVFAWLMTFLDTVDGKLARCTLTSSRFGNVFDHALDLVHPPIWWAAWAVALPGGIAGHELSVWVVIGGYLLGRVLEGTFSWAFGIQMFVWRPFDAFFRTIISRRNPNLLLLTGSLCIGAPVLGFQAVAAWTAACIVIAFERNVRAHVEARRGVEIHAWLDDPHPGQEGENTTSH